MPEIDIALPPRPKAPWYVPATVRSVRFWRRFKLAVATLIWMLAVSSALDGAWFFMASNGLSALVFLATANLDRIHLEPAVRELEAAMRLNDAMAIALPMIDQILADLQPQGLDAWIAQQEARVIRPTRH